MAAAPAAPAALDPPPHRAALRAASPLCPSLFMATAINSACVRRSLAHCPARSEPMAVAHAPSAHQLPASLPLRGSTDGMAGGCPLLRLRPGSLRLRSGAEMPCRESQRLCLPSRQRGNPALPVPTALPSCRPWLGPGRAQPAAAAGLCPSADGAAGRAAAPGTAVPAARRPGGGPLALGRHCRGQADGNERRRLYAGFVSRSSPVTSDRTLQLHHRWAAGRLFPPPGLHAYFLGGGRHLFLDASHSEPPSPHPRPFSQPPPPNQPHTPHPTTPHP